MTSPDQDPRNDGMPPDRPRDPIRVGIVGAGGNTVARHIPGLLARDDVEIVGVCNRSRESSERVAGEHGIARVYDRWTDLVAAPDIDAVVIGTWPYLHCRVTVAALDTGKHVLCEARMAMNASEARAMLDASLRHPELIAHLVPAPMSLHADETIRRLLADGYAGRILAVEVRDGDTFLDAGAPLHWRQDHALSGVNVMSLGIWYETVMRWIGEATRVTAMGRTFTTMRRDAGGRPSAVRIPDHVDVLAEMACGAQASFRISRVTGFAPSPGAYLFGDEGTLHFADGRLFGGRKGDPTMVSIPLPTPPEAGWRVEEEFVNAIRGIEPVTRTTFEDGVRYMEFTEAVARSMTEGRSISLPL